MFMLLDSQGKHVYFNMQKMFSSLHVNCKCLSWPLGVARFLWLWTRSEICPLCAPSKEPVFEWVLEHNVHWELSDCESGEINLNAAAASRNVV